MRKVSILYLKSYREQSRSGVFLAKPHLPLDSEWMFAFGAWNSRRAMHYCRIQLGKHDGKSCLEIIFEGNEETERVVVGYSAQLNAECKMRPLLDREVQASEGFDFTFF